MIKIGGQLVTLSDFKRFRSNGALSKNQLKKQRRRIRERAEKSKARGILLRDAPATVPKSDRPFCVFGQHGDAELPAASMGGEIAIYVLIDPRDNTVRYVGKSNDPERRLAEHASSSMPWAVELRSLGLSMVMRIVDRASLQEWERAEQYWIAFYSRHGRILNTEVGGRGYANAYYKRVRWARRKLRS
jgi:predicted GIY-YIG superfamily endonuclease